MLVFAPPARAQASDPLVRMSEFAIEAQELETALQIYSRATGMQVISDPIVVAGKRSGRIQGRMSQKEALERMLEGSGLSFAVVGNAVAITSKPAGPDTTINRPPAPARQSQDAAGSGRELENIVITGFRNSLNKALEVKREASGVVDAIVAEDIAKFPDNNLGEALERIPGVTIERDIGGEGRSVSIRSLGADFTNTTINGLVASSSEDVRAVRFDIFASELVSRAKVAKTSSADMVEGGVAGTVMLEMARPFDFQGFRFAASAEGVYDTLAETLDPKLTAFVSDVFADGAFGVMASVAYSDWTLREDVADNVVWRELSVFNSVPNTDPNAQALFARIPRALMNVEHRKRLGFVGAAQFRPRDEFEVRFEGMYSTFNRDRIRYSLDASIDRATAVPSDLTIVDGVVRAGTFSAVPFVNDTRDEHYDIQFHQATLTTEWKPNEDWIVAALVGGNQTDYDTGIRRRFDVRRTDTVRYSSLEDERILLYSSPNFTFDNPAGFTLETLRREAEKRLDTYQLAKLDIDRFWHDGSLLAGVKSGLMYSEKRRKNRDFRTDDTSVRGTPFSSFAANLRDLAPGGAFLGGRRPDGYPAEFVFTDVAAAVAALDPNPAFPAERLQGSYDVNEQVLAGYFRTDLEGRLGNVPVRADLGVRVVRTMLDSMGYQQRGAVFLPIATSRSYTDVLPNANLVFDLSGDLMARFAVARVMTRPPLADIAWRRTVSATSISEGNPDLDPFRASQVDATLEWYFAPEALASVAVFYKDIDSFITSKSEFGIFEGDTYLFTRPVNGDAASIKGLELSFQTPFSWLSGPWRGFGIAANYTYVDSRAEYATGTGIVYPLAGLSKHAFNLTGYYERGPVHVRLAYTWRDDYVMRVEVNRPLYRDAGGQLDFRASYAVSDAAKLTFSVLNLTNAPVYEYDTVHAQSEGYRVGGRRLFMGASFSY